MTSAHQDEARMVRHLRERLYRECDLAVLTADGGGGDQTVLRTLVTDLLAEERRVLDDDRVLRVIDAVVAATTGLGPLELLLADPEVSEIMVNGPDTIFMERDGVLERARAVFDDDDHVRQVIDRILAPTGRRLDALTPMVDTRLPDGSRVNAVIPPLAVEGSTLTIRRFLRKARTLDDLEALGSVTPDARRILDELMSARTNVLVAGGTGSGKTTLLAAVMAQCDASDRIIVIEDAAELAIDHPHRVRLEARPALPGADFGADPIAVRDLVRNALRMRPDRIIVGEVRGAEAFDMVQAMSTGHRGCWSTVHANSSHDALLRIESMAMLADIGVSTDVIRAQIARAIGGIVFVERTAGGARCIASIERVRELDGRWSVEPLLESA